MSLSFYGKRPGPGMRLDKLSLQFAMHDTGLIGDVLEAYERLILDAMRGDHTLFTTAEGIERLWEVSHRAAGSAAAGALLRAGFLGAERHPSARRAASPGGCRSSAPGAIPTRWQANRAELIPRMRGLPFAFNPPRVLTASGVRKLMTISASRRSPARSAILSLAALAGAAAFAAFAAFTAAPNASVAAPKAPRAARKTPVVAQEVRSIEGVTEYRLANGLQVLLYPDQSSSTVSINVTYKVGSRHESYGETGMAHMLEHMNFKGTPTHPKIMDELSSHGAHANATTAYDRTNYFETFPRPRRIWSGRWAWKRTA